MNCLKRPEQLGKSRGAAALTGLRLNAFSSSYTANCDCTTSRDACVVAVNSSALRPLASAQALAPETELSPEVVGGAPNRDPGLGPSLLAVRSGH